MSRIVTVNELQARTQDVMNWACTEDDAVIVETYGKPVVAILSFDNYQKYLQNQKKNRKATRFERLRQMAAQNAAVNDLNEAEALAFAEEVREEKEMPITL